MFNFMWKIIKRDILIAARSGGDGLSVVLFFIIATCLFPLALTPNSPLLKMMAPAILWLCALFASMLSMDNIFAQDYEDGTLDQLLILGLPWGCVVAAKLFSFWLLTALPLLCVAPFLAVMLGIKGEILPQIVTILFIGTVIFTLVGGMGASLVLKARYRSVLLPLIVLPLTIPPLIFGTSAMAALIEGGNWGVDVEFLLAFCFFFLPVCLWAGICGLRSLTE